MKTFDLNLLWAAVVDQAYEDWRVSPRTAAVFLVTPFLAVFVAGAISLGYKPLIQFLAHEDGFF